MKLKKFNVKIRKDLLNSIEETFGKGMLSWVINYSLEKALEGEENELRKDLQRFILESKKQE